MHFHENKHLLSREINNTTAVATMLYGAQRPPLLIECNNIVYGTAFKIFSKWRMEMIKLIFFSYINLKYVFMMSARYSHANHLSNFNKSLNIYICRLRLSFKRFYNKKNMEIIKLVVIKIMKM